MRAILMAVVLACACAVEPTPAPECDPDAAPRVEPCVCDGGRGAVSVCGEWPPGTGIRWQCKCKPSG